VLPAWAQRVGRFDYSAIMLLLLLPPPPHHTWGQVPTATHAVTIQPFNSQHSTQTNARPACLQMSKYWMPAAMSLRLKQ
jgi:hypothetical protein